MMQLTDNEENKNIYNHTLVNTSKSREEIVKNIINSRIIKDNHLIAKSLQKRKKLPDNFLPKSEILLSRYKNDLKHKDKVDKKQKKDEKNNKEKSIPFKFMIFDFQKKLNKANTLIKRLNEENKMFHDGYEKNKLLFQDGNNNIKSKTNITNSEENDIHNNNIFNQSVLLTNKKRIPDYILESLDNKETKEDLQLIEYLQKNFKKGYAIQTPDFLIKKKLEKNERRKLYKNIFKMKKEIKNLENTISNYEKNLDSMYELEPDINNDKNKELNSLKDKIETFQKKENNKTSKLNLDDISKAKSTKNVGSKLILSPYDTKGEYNLVTKCNINDKIIPNIKRDMRGMQSMKIKPKDFLKTYNKSKNMFYGTKRVKFTSDLTNYNYNISNLSRKDRRQTLKKKLFNYEKYMDSLSSCLDSFTDKKNEKDIFKLYTYMKNSNLMNIKELLTTYKEKYGKDYSIQNISPELKKYRDRFNIGYLIRDLNKLNNTNIAKGQKNRLKVLENMKMLDAQLKDGGMKFAKRNHDFY